ncbi:MAG TPA: hypothetical protein VJI71_00510, partial [Candidatus Norongarragalinales archaeon]|nr:hypothetical protein [Candidatus Norongarragalinales archaeon]
ATETDVGVGMDSGWVDVTFPNGSNYNLTLTPNSGDASDCAGGASVYDREIHVGSTGGTLTLNMFYGNDTRANIGRDDVHTSLQVTVTAAADPAELKVAQFRLWRNPTDIIGNGSVDPAVYDFLACNVSSSFGNNIGSGETCNSTSPGTAYRAEVRYCNDGPSGATPVSFTTANHISLSSQFIGSLTDCGSGDNGTSWTGTGCASYTGSDGLPVVEITGNTVIPAGDGSTRTDTNCDYYAYRFNTGNPDWIVTDITTANATGATSGSDPTSGSFNVNTTYSETAFALFYPSSGCTVGNGSEGRVRPRYYNETVDAVGTCGGYEIQACDPQLAVDGGWNDSNSYAISGGSPIPGDVYYNFTGVNGEQGAVYWTYKTTGTATLNVWDWTDGRWEILDSGTDASITTRAIAIPGGQDYVSPYGALNLTQNSSDAGANNLFDVYYDGNHTDKCAKCFFTTVNPNAKNVACEGQTGGGLSGTSFFDLQNLGSVIEDWKVFIDSAMPTGIDFFINDSSSTHVTLSTTPQTFNSSIEFFEHAYAWAWANFTNVGASSNERQFTSNTSWK